MAKRELDWFTVRYKDIFLVAFGILALAGIVGGAFFYWRYQGNPQVRAERAIAKAQTALDALDMPDASAEAKSSISQGKTMIGEARAEYSQGHYAKALAVAGDALETLKNARSTSPQNQKFAVLVSSEGSVEVKRIGQHLFGPAKDNMILEDGDIVKTGRRATRGIKYHNNQFQSISPDSLVVIQALSGNASGGSRIEVALKQGSVETQTPDTMTAKDESIIVTDTTRIRPAPASRVGVAQEASGQVVTAVLAGTIRGGGRGQAAERGGGQHRRLHHHVRHPVQRARTPHLPAPRGIPQGPADHPRGRPGAPPARLRVEGRRLPSPACSSSPPSRSSRPS